jgi:hypothetical protein
MPTVPITDALRKAARDLLDEDAARPHGRLRSEDRKQLKAIADPASRRKFIDVDWWRWVHGRKYVHAYNIEDAPANRAKVEKLEALADPKRNPNEHERKIAEAKLANFKPKQPPSAPGLEEYDREQAEWKAERDRQLAEFRAAMDATWPKTLEELEARRQAVKAENRAKRAAAKAKREAGFRAALEKIGIRLPEDPIEAAAYLKRLREERGSAREAAKPVSDSVAAPEPTPPPKSNLKPVSDSVAAGPEPIDEPVSDSVTAAEREPVSDTVRNASGYAPKEEPMQPRRNASGNTPPRVVRANAQRAAARAQARARRKCAVCGKRLKAARSTARFCGPTCRSKAWRAR